MINKALVVDRYLPISDPSCFYAVTLEAYDPTHYDVLVEIRAISLNPIDTKVRAQLGVNVGAPKVLGWDAAGVIVKVGGLVKDFEPGDEVYYTGALHRSGSNQQYQQVDSRLIAKKPKTLNFVEAAALPLTALTAYEGLTQRLALKEDDTGALLLIAGAGGVGSIAIQLAKLLTNTTVMATASRTQTIEWCRKMGSDYELNHYLLPDELPVAGYEKLDYIFCLTDPSQYWDAMIEMIKPYGAICTIVDASGPIDINLLKVKSASLAWESVFTASTYNLPSQEQQGRFLATLATWVDAGKIQSTMYENLGPMTPESLRLGHEKIESGHAIGKIVLEAIAS